MRKLASLLLLLLIVGCSHGPALDCSSEQTYTASMKQITDPLPKKDSELIANAVLMGSWAASIQAANAGKTLQPYELAKEFDGMTGAQIIARGEVLNREARKR